MEERPPPSADVGDTPSLPPPQFAGDTPSLPPNAVVFPAGDTPPFPPPPKSAALAVVETPPVPPQPSKSAALAVGGDHATYVVHFPRDQIYRVPPPEHARIIESHQNLKRRPENSRRKKIIYCVAIPLILIPLILGGVYIALRQTVYNPAPPDVAFSRVHGQNLDAKKPPEYDVTLRVTNKKKQMSVSFPGGAGEGSLVYKTQIIGKGKMGSGGGGAFTDAADVPLVLSGKGVSLSAAARKALSGTAENTMAFNAEVPMEMKSWARNEMKDLKISCDFKVQSLFNKTTKISFQECVSKF